MPFPLHVLFLDPIALYGDLHWYLATDLNVVFFNLTRPLSIRLNRGQWRPVDKNTKNKHGVDLEIFWYIPLPHRNLEIKAYEQKKQNLIKCCSSLISFFRWAVAGKFKQNMDWFVIDLFAEAKWKTPLIVVAKCTFPSHWITCFTCSPSNALFGISRTPNVTCYPKEWLRGSLHIWLIKAVNFIVTRQRTRTSRTIHEWYVRGLQH